MPEKPRDLLQRFHGGLRLRSRVDHGNVSRASTPTPTAGASLVRPPTEPALELSLGPFQATDIAVESPATVSQTAPNLPLGEESSPEPRPSNVERLWDEAYDAIKKDDAKLVEGYERILSQYLSGEGSIADSAAASLNTINSINRHTRREQMNELVRIGLRRMRRAAKTKSDGLGATMEIVHSLKEMVNTAIAAVPQASIAWAGVWVSLGVREHAPVERIQYTDRCEDV